MDTVIYSWEAWESAGRGELGTEELASPAATFLECVLIGSDVAAAALGLILVPQR